MLFVNPTTAALAAAYAGNPPMFSLKAIDDILTIAPPPAARIDGATACEVKNTCRRLTA